MAKIRTEQVLLVTDKLTSTHFIVFFAAGNSMQIERVLASNARD